MMAEQSWKKHKKVHGDDSSNSSDGDDLHYLKSSDFGWSKNVEASGISSRFQNPDLAKKTNLLRQCYLKSKKSTLCDLKGQFTCPEFPPSLWEAILLN